MIQIVDKSQCCGCTACVSVCPKQCIAMQEDEEGFLYPVVDTSLCIDCNLCQKVCPELHPMNTRTPLHVYAAKHKDEQIRLASSSGGIFTLLAEKVIDEGEWSLEHVLMPVGRLFMIIRKRKKDLLLFGVPNMCKAGWVTVSQK